MLANFARFQPPTSPRPLPRRIDSLNASKSTTSPSTAHQKLASTSALPPIFAAVEDEVRDARRVGTHGQEEDLKHALGNVIGRVEELSNLLREAYRATAELETSLGLARSNLTLVQANNEMLEEALKRNDASGGGNSAKDIGWRRWSAKEGQQREARIEEERPRSLDYGSLKGAQTQSSPSSNLTPNMNGAHGSAPASAMTSPSPLSAGSSPLSSPSVVPPTPSTGQESRFFRGFRFSGSGTQSGSSTPASRTSRSPTRSPIIIQNQNPYVNTLTSPSLPSLKSTPDGEYSKEMEETRAALVDCQRRLAEAEEKLASLSGELEKERKERKKAADEKTELEAEIESLSQALFEEANKMVAHERIKRAETEEELREARIEQDALKSALMVVEGENDFFRNSSPILTRAEEPPLGFGMGGDEQEPPRRRAIDLDTDAEAELERQRRSAIDESREAGPSRSRSSSQAGLRSPGSHSSRTSSDSVIHMLKDPPDSAQPPDPPTTASSFSINGRRSPSPLPTPEPSPSPALDAYATPEAQSRSQSYSQSDTQSQDGETNVKKEDTKAKIPDPASYFSPPEPSFDPSSPGSMLDEEPSPWA